MSWRSAKGYGFKRKNIIVDDRNKDIEFVYTRIAIIQLLSVFSIHLSCVSDSTPSLDL